MFSQRRWRNWPGKRRAKTNKAGAKNGRWRSWCERGGEGQFRQTCLFFGYRFQELAHLVEALGLGVGALGRIAGVILGNNVSGILDSLGSKGVGGKEVPEQSGLGV